MSGTLVTVCIPAYRSGPKIGATLEAVRGQTLRDFRVVIGLDSPAADEVRFLEPFLDDKRFALHENSERLGWDGNVRKLMRGVDSACFLLLPHDDLIHPTYLEILAGRVLGEPSSSVAYADLLLFGGDHVPAIKMVDLPPGGPADQVMRFLLQGAEAVPWKGVARSSVLREHDFPVDGFGGFAAECEWALRLLLHGTGLRVGRPLYYKRHPARWTGTASRRWGDLALDALIQAWKDHRRRMLEMIEELDGPGRRPDLRAAAEAALLGRLVEAVRVSRTPSSVIEPVAGEMETVNEEISRQLGRARDRSRTTAKIEAMRIVANARWRAWLGEWEEALDLTTEAMELDAASLDALLLRARALAKANRRQEALDATLMAASVAPHQRGVMELMSEMAERAGLTAEQDPAAAPVRRRRLPRLFWKRRAR